MQPAILIVEPRREVADALEDVVTSAHYPVIVRPHLERLSDIAATPAAIIVRISFEGISEPPHEAVARLPLNRPPVIAIARDDAEVAEAHRLKFEVVLRAPDDVGRLFDILSRLVHA